MRASRGLGRAPQQAIGLVERRLAALHPLSPEETELVRGLDRTPEYVRQGHDIVRARAPLTSTCMIVSGWACRYEALADGRRQIFSLLLPGDFIGFYLRAHPLALASVVALTRVQLLSVAPLLDAARREPARRAALADAVDVMQAIEEAQLLNQIMRIGRLTAYERTCDLLLETYYRLNAVGLAANWRFALPLTQEVLADALGLSIVHVNRTLTQLRREKMIEFSHGQVELLQPAQIASIAEFQRPRAAEWRKE